MLTIIRDADGRLQAACEWTPCRDDGTADAQGRWVFVHQLEITVGLRRHAIIRQIIEDIACLMPKAIGAYWQRHDRTHYRIHWYSRKRLLRGGMLDGIASAHR